MGGAFALARRSHTLRPILLIIWPPADSPSRRHSALRYASVVLTPDDQSITQCEPAECEISGLSAADRHRRCRSRDTVGETGRRVLSNLHRSLVCVRLEAGVEDFLNFRAAGEVRLVLVAGQDGLDESLVDCGYRRCVDFLP